jgi:regulator of protease activity HflC (stomatin/prohibitin superfamily)
MFYIAVFLFVVAVIVWWFTRSSTDSDVQKIGRYGAISAFVFSLLFFLFSSIRVVPAGHVGVRTLFGTIDPKPIYSGMHLVNPLCNVVTIPVRTMEYTMVARSAEGSRTVPENLT